MTFFYSFYLLFLSLLGTNNVPVSVDASVKITVNNLRNNKGHVLVSLFNNADGFPNKAEKAIRKSRLAIKDKTTWVLFTNLPAGKYAAAILHDENDDERMNTNFLGLPREGYGFSNNVMGTFGPPSFSKAGFQIESSVKEVVIKAKY